MSVSASAPPTDATALAGYAAHANAPASLRQEALHAAGPLAAAAATRPDRRHLSPLAEKTRPAAVAADALSPHLDQLLPAGDTGIGPGPLQFRAAVTLKISVASTALQAVVANPGQPARIRISAAQALDQLGDPRLDDSVGLALAAPESELRLAAAGRFPAGSTGIRRRHPGQAPRKRHPR